MYFLRRLPHRTKRFVQLPKAARHGFVMAVVLEPCARGSIRLLGYQRGLKCTEVVGRLLRRRSLSTQPEALQRGYELGLKALPGRGSCLTRSVSLYSLLRAHGHLAKLNVGVTGNGGTSSMHASATLGAHAWVELDGAAIGLDGQSVQQYRLLGTLAG
jgi:hypothetical protein